MLQIIASLIVSQCSTLEYQGQALMDFGHVCYAISITFFFFFKFTMHSIRDMGLKGLSYLGKKNANIKLIPCVATLISV